MRLFLKTYLNILYDLYTSPTGRVITLAVAILADIILLISINMFLWLFLNIFIVAPAVYYFNTPKYRYPDPFDGRRYGHDKR